MIGFQTPDWVTHKMCDLLNFKPEIILEPTPGEGFMVKILQSRFPQSNVLYPQDYWKYRKYGPYFRPEVIIANPPFSPMKKGYDFLFDFMELTDRIISIMPWYSIIQSVKRTQKILNFGLKRVIHLPRSVFRGSRVNCCVLDLHFGYHGPVALEFWSEP
jgi:hypothetical protein